MKYSDGREWIEFTTYSSRNATDSKLKPFINVWNFIIQYEPILKTTLYSWAQFHEHTRK